MEDHFTKASFENELSSPLVSIIVITYNSSQFLPETLESIKNQTYQNIELIITDDASTDNTLEICTRWLSDNSQRFTKSLLLTSDKNKGISSNCNRGAKVARGQWIKLLAADDVLINNAIELYINFITTSKEAIKIIHSALLHYENSFDESNFLSHESLASHLIAAKNVTPEIQYQVLLRGCYVHTPTVLISKSIFTDVGYFDEQYRNIEDWPLWIRVAKAGIKFYYLDNPTVKYRMHPESVSNKIYKGKLLKELSLSEWPIYRDIVIDHVTLREKKIHILMHKRLTFLLKAGLNRNTFFAKIFNYISYYPLKRKLNSIENKIFKKLKKTL